MLKQCGLNTKVTDQNNRNVVSIEVLCHIVRINEEQIIQQIYERKVNELRGKGSHQSC